MKGAAMSPVLVISLVLAGWLVITLALGIGRRHWLPPVLAAAALAGWLLTMQQVWDAFDAAVFPDAGDIPTLGVVYLAATSVFLVSSVVAAGRAVRRRGSAR